VGVEETDQVEHCKISWARQLIKLNQSAKDHHTAIHVYNTDTANARRERRVREAWRRRWREV
jgi:hypothetical protein